MRAGESERLSERDALGLVMATVPRDVVDAVIEATGRREQRNRAAARPFRRLRRACDDGAVLLGPRGGQVQPDRGPCGPPTVRSARWCRPTSGSSGPGHAPWPRAVRPQLRAARLERDARRVDAARNRRSSSCASPHLVSAAPTPSAPRQWIPTRPGGGHAGEIGRVAPRTRHGVPRRSGFHGPPALQPSYGLERGVVMAGEAERLAGRARASRGRLVESRGVPRLHLQRQSPTLPTSAVIAIRPLDLMDMATRPDRAAGRVR